MRSLVNELGLKFSTPPIIWCYNQKDAYLVSNQVYHARTKHIEIDAHYI